MCNGLLFKQTVFSRCNDFSRNGLRHHEQIFLASYQIVLMKEYMKRWYLIHTKPRKEMVAEQSLHRQDCEIYLPRIQQSCYQRGRWIDVIEPLFLRYLFVRLRLGHDDGPIRYTANVRDLVRFFEKLVVVSDQIVELIKSIADLYTGLQCFQNSLFESSDIVIINIRSFRWSEGDFFD